MLEHPDLPAMRGQKAQVCRREEVKGFIYWANALAGGFTGRSAVTI